MKTVLEAVGVNKVYQTGVLEHAALEGVTLSIHEGDFAALCGPSGSGKTTLLNLFGAIDSPTTGEIKVLGRATSGLSDDELADLRAERLGFVFQNFNLVPVLSAQENVELALLRKGWSEEKCREAASQALMSVGLSKFARHRPSQLSGGQRQRVAIARALAAEPAVILADEPTANLDHATAADLLQLMLELNRTQGRTFLFSTHDPEIMRLARRLVYLRDGRIVSDKGAQ